MKKLLVMLIGLAVLTGQGFSQQTLKIGEVKNGEFEITNEKAINAYFLNCLGYSGIPGKDINIEPSPDGDRYFVYTSVSGNKDHVSSVGVLLVNRDNEVVITEARREEDDSPGPGVGGSMNVKCVGNPCGICLPELEWQQGQWYPMVRCICFDPNGTCNSEISFTVNLNVGF